MTEEKLEKANDINSRIYNLKRELSYIEHFMSDETEVYAELFQKSNLLNKYEIGMQDKRVYNDLKEYLKSLLAKKRALIQEELVKLEQEFEKI